MKEFYGKYASASEARRAVEELLDRGYTRDQIRVVSRDDLGGNLERTHEGQHEDDRSVWEKIKDAFTFDEYDDNYWDRDHDDYNRAAIEEHRDDLQAGQILVLVDHRAAETTHPMADGLDETTHADHDRAHMDHAHHDEVHHRDDRHLNEEERVMELHKEKLNVDKERVETGEETVRHEEIEVEGDEHVRDAHRHEEHPPFDPDNKLNR